MGGTVRGEEEQSEGASVAGPRRARTGPRHAAPKKSMLTRLQVPAGKAIALAAMPTAVLMGMGLTPQLAQATSRAEDRYKPGPCVTQSDEADKDDAKDHKSTDEAGETSKGSKDKGSDGKSQDKGSEDKGGDKGATPTPSATSSADSGSSGSETDDTADTKAPEKSPSPSPSESKSKNPLDPLGLGDAIEDIFTGGGDDEDKTAEPSATPTPSSSATGSSGRTTDPAKDTADKAKDTVDTADKAAKDAVDKAKDKADETPSPGPTSSSSPKAEDPDKSGKEPFPCPTYDAEAYENAETEPNISLVPEEPWTLKSTLLTLHGLDYKGIVEVKTYSGKVKKVLKFTASGVEIDDLHQLTVGAGGTTTHVAARKGSTSTFSNGPITMYTEELSGNLLGIVPITFSPKTPPPLNLPEVFFTDVTVKQAGQFGGDLTIPGMHLYKTGE
ncbi:hydrogenase expression protein HypF [Streptomyces sp. ME19-01-6]|uniref:hydrogenase expression protein HypF n=1 Tax=Streptomyces sp. ME19-01-6 TaxID=3028686 RepID=UPI0029B10BB0|nr:hydrogenase expression protein HypF [Streptomyces sp. ME19-01-6]MDX3225405.1 hydrogenase expression protein HypF [Streptomyces sp. ME19-01-6]